MKHHIPAPDRTPLAVSSFPEDEGVSLEALPEPLTEVREIGSSLRRMAGIGTFSALIALGAIHLGADDLKHADGNPPKILPAVAPEPAAPVRPDASIDISGMSLEGKALAAELRRMGTHHPNEFVTVISEALGAETRAEELALHLALANAETGGDILDVSEAGAVGMAQATPIAMLQQGYPGPLYITEDYATGARAYFLKKPLNDADAIASLLLIEGRGAAEWQEAQGLLRAAERYRCLGIEELQVLSPYAGASFQTRIETMDAHNLTVLTELAHLLETRAPQSVLREFRDRVRAEYRALRGQQRESWAKYQADLIQVRDQAIRDLCGLESRAARRHSPYETGEMLSTVDIRFSPRDGANFLRDHIQSKRAEALRISGGEGDQNELTERLYNGGSHNVLRMRAGLIGRLKENDDYVRRIDRFEARLIRALPPQTATGLEAVTAPRSPAQGGVR